MRLNVKLSIFAKFYIMRTKSLHFHFNAERKHDENVRRNHIVKGKKKKHFGEETDMKRRRRNLLTLFNAKCVKSL